MEGEKRRATQVVCSAERCDAMNIPTSKQDVKIEMVSMDVVAKSKDSCRSLRGRLWRLKTGAVWMCVFATQREHLRGLSPEMGLRNVHWLVRRCPATLQQVELQACRLSWDAKTVGRQGLATKWK